MKDRETWIVGGRKVPRPSVTETVELLEQKGYAPTWDEPTLQVWWEEETEKAGVYAPIPMVVSPEGHNIGHRDAYADATVHYEPLQVVLHPLLFWADEDYIRKVMRHELSHIKAAAKRKKGLREAIGS